MQLTHGRKDRHVSPRRYLSLIWVFFTREKVSPVKKEIPSLSCADLEGKGAGFYPQGNSNYSNFYRKITENMPRTRPSPPPPGGANLNIPQLRPRNFFDLRMCMTRDIVFSFLKIPMKIIAYKSDKTYFMQKTERMMKKRRTEGDFEFLGIHLYFPASGQLWYAVL